MQLTLTGIEHVTGLTLCLIGDRNQAHKAYIKVNNQDRNQSHSEGHPDREIPTVDCKG